MHQQIKNSIRKLIVQHRQEGESINQIAEIFKINRRTVGNICKRYEETGSVSSAKSTGSSRSTTVEEDEHLRQTSKQNPFKSARVMKSELALPVSINIVKRRLRESKLGGRTAANKQLLTARNMIDRIGFAYQYKDRTHLDWNTIVFSDEKIFNSDGDGDVWVQRPKGPRYESPYIFQKRRSGRFTVDVWGWMTSAGPGELIRIDRKLTATQYIDILENSFVTSLQMLFGEAAIYFVRDKSPIHMARLTKNWLAQQQQIKIIDWPAIAADLNPIENLWANLTKDLLTVSAPDYLWENIYLKWEQYRQTDKCQVLVKSMPRRIARVIENGGFWTKY